MKYVVQGLLHTRDKMENYQQVKFLSNRQGRTVRPVTNFDRKHMVIKSYNLTTNTHLLHFSETCSKLGALRGMVNIVHIIGVFINGHWGHILMHHYAGGDLASWLRGYPQRGPKLCLRIAYQIVTAVRDLHAREIVHCDLKPEYIFLTSTLEAVLGDFDVVVDANGTMTNAAGVARNYEAPDIRTVLVNRFEKSADVYSLGLLLRELFNGVSLSDTYKGVSDEDIVSLYARMSAEHFIHRPTLAEVESMPVFREVQSARLGAICCEAYVAAESLSCRNGHKTCNGCLNDWLCFDMSNSSSITRINGLSPCPMQAHGCEKIWDP